MWPVGSVTLLVYTGGWCPTGLFTGEQLSLPPPGKMECNFWMECPNLRAGYRWMSSVFLFVSRLGF